MLEVESTHQPGHTSTGSSRNGFDLDKFTLSVYRNEDRWSCL